MSRTRSESGKRKTAPNLKNYKFDNKGEFSCYDKVQKEESPVEKESFIMLSRQFFRKGYCKDLDQWFTTSLYQSNKENAKIYDEKGNVVFEGSIDSVEFKKESSYYGLSTFLKFFVLDSLLELSTLELTPSGRTEYFDFLNDPSNSGIMDFHIVGKQEKEFEIGSEKKKCYVPVFEPFSGELTDDQKTAIDEYEPQVKDYIS